jgi:ribonuclease P/MRP protein subunit RPP1
MKITDACVCPYPCGDSSVRRMALEAKDLGLERLVVKGVPSGEIYGIELYTGILIRDMPLRDLVNCIRREKNNHAVVSVQAGDSGFNRAVITTKGVHILRGIQYADKNAFDHVTARMAADNRVAVDIDLSSLISGRGIARQRAIHRYRDIMVLEQRFGFQLVISSHARSVLEMRSVREITGLCSLIGMDMPGVEKAFSGIDMVTTPPDASVRVI